MTELTGASLSSSDRTPGAGSIHGVKSLCLGLTLIALAGGADAYTGALMAIETKFLAVAVGGTVIGVAGIIMHRPSVGALELGDWALLLGRSCAAIALVLITIRFLPSAEDIQFHHAARDAAYFFWMLAFVPLLITLGARLALRQEINLSALFGVVFILVVEIFFLHGFGTIGNFFPGNGIINLVASFIMYWPWIILAAATLYILLTARLATAIRAQSLLLLDCMTVCSLLIVLGLLGKIDAGTISETSFIAYSVLGAGGWMLWISAHASSPVPALAPFYAVKTIVFVLLAAVLTKNVVVSLESINAHVNVQWRPVFGHRPFEISTLWIGGIFALVLTVLYWREARTRA